MPKPLNRYFADSAPTMPVSTANTAASAGTPPMRSAMPIATGAVTDFGASERTTSSGRPSQRRERAPRCRRRRAPPTSAAIVSATPRRRTSARRTQSGQASATTAGPSSTWMNCAPAK